MRVYLDEMKSNCFVRFEYITTLNNSQQATFVQVMEMMILNLDIRFPCPGFSLEIGMAKRNTDMMTKTLVPEFGKRMAMRYPFMMEVDLFNFTDRFIKDRQINMWFVNTFHEMEAFLTEVVENERMILEKAPLSKQDRQEKNNDIVTLFDVFKVVDRTKYPVLWDVVLRVLTYTPTSVSCEKCFSILKRRMHENMKRKTLSCLWKWQKEPK